MTTSHTSRLRRLPHERLHARLRYYGYRRCTTRSRKTMHKQRLNEVPEWLCDCGHFQEGLFHCEYCGNQPPPGCVGECCQSADEEFDEYENYDWDPEYDDFGDPVPAGGAP